MKAQINGCSSITLFSVVFIDDEEKCLRSFSRMLTGLPWKATFFRNPLQALLTLTQPQSPVADIIFLDISMPEFNGIELLRCLKINRRTVSIPVIMLTADGRHDTVVEALQAGAADYLLKPFDPPLLLKKARRHLGAHTPHSGRHSVPKGSSDVLERAYRILDCKVNDTDEILKSAYRRMALKYHPDIMAGKALEQAFIDFAEERFREIHQAYKTIMMYRSTAASSRPR